jgi:hypothetical protein
MIIIKKTEVACIFITLEIFSFRKILLNKKTTINDNRCFGLMGITKFLGI